MIAWFAMSKDVLTFDATTASTSPRVQRVVSLDRFRAITLICDIIHKFWNPFISGFYTSISSTIRLIVSCASKDANAMLDFFTIEWLGDRVTSESPVATRIFDVTGLLYLKSKIKQKNQRIKRIKNKI